MGTRKGMQGWKVRSHNPEEPEGQQTNFPTICTDNRKFYNLDGYIPKGDSKHDTFQEEYIANLPKDQRKNKKFVDCMQSIQVLHRKCKTFATTIGNIYKNVVQVAQQEKQLYVLALE
ncbi:MAG: hypothetical protein EZS28_010293 [Streblomastix strix]|uniref:Uncharacterized protein n=1 Tax=Streblomastix strix TaxID=222440 RepID=A0A5J4WGP4_9EUKA|nr:MAG: hypothetical protein EZS28_010293 [Streblomastix strix]